MNPILCPLLEVPGFFLLNIQNPREIKMITIIAEKDAISGTIKFFFFLHDSFLQRLGLSSTLKEVKGVRILVIISLLYLHYLTLSETKIHIF